VLVLGLIAAALAVCGAGAAGAGAPSTTAAQNRMPARVSSWSTWGFNKERTRVGPNVGLPKGEPLWHASEMVGRFGDLIEYPPSIAGGRLFYCTNGGGTGGQVIARSLADGSELWRFRLPGGGQFAAEPTVDGNVVYIGSMGAKPGRGDGSYKPEILALRADSSDPAGSVLWRRTIGNSIESSPLVIGRRLFFAAQKGYLYCFDKNSGQPLWPKPQKLGSKTTSSPAYANGRVIVATYGLRHYATIWAFATSSGKVAWKTTVRGEFYGSPAVYGQRIVTASKSNGRIYCLDAQNGKVLWNYYTNQVIYASPAVWNNTIYIGSASRCFWAIDVRTGRPTWPKARVLSTRFPNTIFGSATVLNGVVYFSTKPLPHHKTGTTFAVDGRTGKVKWRFPDGDYSPVTATSDYILVTGQHTIYAFRPR